MPLPLTASEIEARLERILPTVDKPGRYAGGELNRVLKPWDSVSAHVALVFPDIYDIGLANLGLAILYDILNRRPDVAAERAYAPWLDLETILRRDGIPLFSLESKHPLASFDIIGITLPYETIYTNTLNILDLAGLPLRSAERNETHPLVIAGGHAAYNPEPMSAFIDAFVIGEGEGVILEIVDAWQAWKTSAGSRADLLAALAHIEGVYVPSFYQVSYHPDGRVADFKPIHPAAPSTITKRIVPQLPPPLTRFLVPSVEVVHNRIAIEIMRGCSRGCRFCQAGMVNRPVRERPVEQILNAMQEAVHATGYEDIGLLSLSSSDYTQILKLTEEANRRFAGAHLTISLPSLRIESFSAELMDNLKDCRASGGFTLAPEAATERMRQIINKPLPAGQLLDTARTVFEHGWTSLKLYFMIGHPSETLEDVQEIIETCYQVLRIGQKIRGGRVKVHAGVSTFVPKPHTPFQWVSCDSVDQINAKLNLLKQGLRHQNLRLTWNEPPGTQLEAWLTRGDRRTGEVILRAWQKGAKFDAWRDQFRFEIWQEAYAEAGIDPAFYSHRQRELDEILPWDHINTGVSKNYLKQDYQWSLDGRSRPDCAVQCAACGILSSLGDLRMQFPNTQWKCP
ncbi:MAG TPA: TIGR03960 family B12-binding radical SAM protein [Anaerolineaceae bacterium]|nr:TIGR03960 family B12-binding radical SAM protein [Anaerolineaceae bacterium]HPN50143.1 TIGR03960 family B12-binding radical SAM protein [Anaerolineaceae bacterium]